MKKEGNFPGRLTLEANEIIPRTETVEFKVETIGDPYKIKILKKLYNLSLNELELIEKHFTK